MPAKKIRKSKDCLNKCANKCSQKITDDERLSIFTDYYKLSLEEKRIFLLKVVYNLTKDAKERTMRIPRKKTAISIFHCDRCEN